MTTDIWLVTGILAATIFAFVLDRFRLDVVAFASMLSLLLSGILTPTEATAGFSNSLVLMIAGLFVVGGAILESGVAELVGNGLSRVGGTSTIRLTVTVMLVTALMSALMSSTGTVAVMLPVVLSLCRRAKVSPSKLLIPLAFAASLGGMLTLIGTPPNMVVNQELRGAGLEPFHFFSFAPAGLLMLCVGIVFMCTVGTRLLPAQPLSLGNVGGEGDGQSDEQRYVSRPELIHSYGVDGRISEVMIPIHSAFAKHTLRELDLRTKFQVSAIAVLKRDSRRPIAHRCNADTVLEAGDTLFIKSSREEAITNLIDKGCIKLVSTPATLPCGVHLAELIIPPRSDYVGKTVAEVGFNRRYGAMVLALHDGKQPIRTGTSNTPLNPGDTLLVSASTTALERLRKSRRNMLLVSVQEEQRATRLSPAARWIVAILLGMLVAMSTGIVANVTAVLVAAALMVFAGAFRGSSAYQSIHWESIVMIASIMPMATALEKTGAFDLLIDTLVESPGLTSPLMLLMLLFTITSLLSQAISNTATSLLVAPLAIDLAQRLDVSPYPLLMGVALAASTSFSTPMASPINALVTGAGGYRFFDFLKVGVPLQLLILVVTIAVVPILFPFAP